MDRPLIANALVTMVGRARIVLLMSAAIWTLVAVESMDTVSTTSVPAMRDILVSSVKTKNVQTTVQGMESVMWSRGSASVFSDL